MAQPVWTMLGLSTDLKCMLTLTVIRKFHPRIIPKENVCKGVHLEIHTRMALTTLFIWDLTWKPAKCPSTEEQINYFNRMIYNSGNEHTTAIHNNRSECYQYTVEQKTSDTKDSGSSYRKFKNRTNSGCLMSGKTFSLGRKEHCTDSTFLFALAFGDLILECLPLPQLANS